MKKLTLMAMCLATTLFAAARAQQPAEAPKEEKHEYTVAKTPEAENDQLLDAIVAQYKGKAVFVDFWATWCGPCVNAMKVLGPLKPEIYAKGVVILYIAGENSPKEKWESMLPSIGGIHYYITKAQWGALCEKYGIKGIPAYLIFDKTGKQTYFKMGYPGNDAVMEELGKVW